MAESDHPQKLEGKEFVMPGSGFWGKMILRPGMGCMRSLREAEIMQFVMREPVNQQHGK